MLSAVWMILFLAFFFRLELPNNSTSADDPLTRGQIWEVISQEWPTLLNPLDYSSGHDAEAGWAYFRQRLPFILTAFVLWFSAWSLGQGVCSRACRTLSLCGSERFVLAMGIGLSLLSLWVLACGVAGILSAPVLLCPSAIAFCWTCLARFRNGDKNDLSAAMPPPAERSVTERKLAGYLILLGLPFAWHIFLGGMTPPMDFDVREYHLQGPKEWFQAGRITTLDHNVYTSFPFLSEMISLAAMVLHGDWWNGAISGKLTLTGFQFLSAVSVFAICRRWVSITAGSVAAVAFLSTPWTVRISIIAYAEGALSFYLIASIMTVFLAAACTDRQAQCRLVAVAGFLAGSAMASKYPGLISVVIPSGAYLTLHLSRSRSVNAVAEPQSGRAGQWFRIAAVYSMGVALAVGPWLIRNTVSNGNPVYPLAYGLFGARDWSPEMDAKWKAAHSPPDHDFLKIPANLIDVVARNDWQNGFLFALAIPSLLLIRRIASVRQLWILVFWMLTTWWALTHRIDRFWVPVLPVLAVLSGAAWSISRRSAWRFFVLAVLTVCCVFNYGFCRLNVIGFHAGLMELQAAAKLPLRQDILLLNSTLSPQARVLMVGEAEVFDADFDLVYNTVFDESIFEQWTCLSGQEDQARADRAMKAPEEIRSILRQQGITHIYVNWSEILRYRLTYGFTDFVFPQRFEQLQTQGVVEPPITMRTGEWNRLTERQRTEVLSWQGGRALRIGDTHWSSIQLYRVSQ